MHIMLCRVSLELRAVTGGFNLYVVSLTKGGGVGYYNMLVAILHMPC